MSNKCVNTCHSSLIEAAKGGCIECVKLLIDKEAGLKDNEDKSALMYAAENGNFKCVELLIPREANLKDKDGKSALDYAKNEEIRKLIQDYLKNN